MKEEWKEIFITATNKLVNKKNMTKLEMDCIWEYKDIITTLFGFEIMDTAAIIHHELFSSYYYHNQEYYICPQGSKPWDFYVLNLNKKLSGTTRSVVMMRTRTEYPPYSL